MNKLMIASLMAGVTAVTTTAPAFADRWDDYGETTYAPVVSSRPVYTQVRVSEPRQECRSEPVVYRQPVYSQGSNPGGAILGGILGGVVGHQFGGGRGRDVATAVGAVIGAGIGGQASVYQGSTEQVSYQQRCQVVDAYHYEDRVQGYDVTYRYNGRLYNTRLPYDPGSRIAVNVDVRPAQY